DGQRAVRLEAIVEQTQRLGDPARRHVLLARQLALAHGRIGIAVGVLAEGDRDVREVIARGAVLVHVAAREHADLVDGPNQPEGPRPLEAPAHALRRLRPGPARLVGALARAPGDGHLGLSGRDRHRGVTDRAAARASAVADLAEVGDVAQTDVARHVDLA